jgi:hypothetical protein
MNPKCFKDKQNLHNGHRLWHKLYYLNKRLIPIDNLFISSQNNIFLLQRNYILLE